MRKILNWLYYKIYGFYLYKGVKYNLNNKKDFERFRKLREEEREESMRKSDEHLLVSLDKRLLVKTPPRRINSFVDDGKTHKSDLSHIRIVPGKKDLEYLTKTYPDVKEEI